MHVYEQFHFYSARQERSAPSLPKKPDQHGRNAADQVSDKLGTMVGADDLPITVRGLQSLLPRQAAELLVRSALIDQRRDHPE